LVKVFDISTLKEYAPFRPGSIGLASGQEGETTALAKGRETQAIIMKSGEVRSRLGITVA
jgi:hypothetical protein